MLANFSNSELFCIQNFSDARKKTNLKNHSIISHKKILFSHDQKNEALLQDERKIN